MRKLLRSIFVGLIASSLAGCFTNPTKESAGPAEVVGPGLATGQPRTTPSQPQKTEPPPAVPAGDIDVKTGPKVASRESKDVWQRIRAGFSLPIPNDRRIDQLMHVYRDQQRMDRIQQRAAPWLPHIANEIEKRGLPMELALLPAVESAYQARVFSPRGAAGIWQFMGATGGQYGLERSWWYDGRMDVVDSTRAALEYLSWLHRRYDGDWLLALAAYNSGIRTVDRAIRRNQRRGRPTDFWHLRLPRETRSYVPQWLALLRIVRDPARYGVVLHPVEDEAAFVTVQLDKPIDLRVAARLTGVPLADLVTLNPGLKHLHTGSSSDYRLHLPRDKAEAFTKRLASIPRSEYHGWTLYRVRPGDVLGRIARRHGTTVAAIRAANGLRSSRIRVGQRLRLPRGEGQLIARVTKTARIEAPRKHSRPAVAKQAKHAKRVATKGTDTARRQSGKGIAYRVRAGDSLWTIGRRFSVPVARLAAWNDIAINQTLRPGQVLRIHAGERNATGSTRIHYRVRKGDSLYLIARRFRVPMKRLQAWNDLDSPRLMPGQRLTLYLE